MESFTTLTAVAAPMPMANIDTDKVIPARFLKTIKRSGLGVHLFDTLRFDADGNERPEFVLNQEPWRKAQIIIAHENFGCGSSREHAPWALLDFGIRCVIAPSFGDIFYNNSFKNGILPIRLPRAICDALIDDAKLGGNARITIDLERQVVVRPMMYIALTYDHRIIDGREAVQFLVTVKQCLEDPARMVLSI